MIETYVLIGGVIAFVSLCYEGKHLKGWSHAVLSLMLLIAFWPLFAAHAAFKVVTR